MSDVKVFSLLLRMHRIVGRHLTLTPPVVPNTTISHIRLHPSPVVVLISRSNKMERNDFVDDSHGYLGLRIALTHCGHILVGEILPRLE